MASSPHRGSLVRAALTEVGRAWLDRVRRFGRGAGRARRSNRLLFAPQDLRGLDPAFAADLAEGLYSFGGRAVPLSRASPFAEPASDPAWSEELHGFGWLRHLRGEVSGATRTAGRALVEDGLLNHRRVLDRATRTPIAARRLGAMLAHSPVVLSGADHRLYHAYLGRIAADASVLRAAIEEAPRPLDRLRAAVGLCLADLCCAGYERHLRRAVRALATELDAQILPDGGHVGRNPGDLLDLLLDLLPLRLLFASRSLQVPPALDRALDRMLPMVRFFRHGSGDLALFNGMGRTPGPEIAAVLAADRSRNAVLQRASASGYDRIEAGGTLVIVETGAVPPLPASAAAHAGCLAFELSSGEHRIVVNCGAASGPEALRNASRQTAAHSTLTVLDASSALALDACEPLARGRAASFLRGRFGPVLLPGPRDVGVERGRSGDDIVLSAYHDGYADRFGAIHTRRLRLSAEGGEFEGEDSVAIGARAPAGEVEATIRFHLDPAVRAEAEEASGGILLTLPGGERWRFGAEGLRPTLAESVLFAVTEGRRPTRQIVLRLGPIAQGGRAALRWIFVRA